MISMLDLAAEHNRLAPAIREAVERVCSSGEYILSTWVRRLEKQLEGTLGAPHVVTVGSGTDALVLALAALGVGPGDEVITSPLTFVATVEAICRLSATPVFADVDPHTLNVCDQSVMSRLTPQTAAVVPVHLYGNTRGIDRVVTACDVYGVPVVEDAAQAFGARLGDRAAGTFGAFGALSFHPTKNLGGYGDGGAVLASDTEGADLIRQLRNHGSIDKANYDRFGLNSRLDEVQAAVLCVKLQTLDQRLTARRQIARIYHSELSDLPLQLPAADDSDCVNSWNYYTVASPQRDQLAKHLQARGIATAVYYRTPLHLQPALHRLGHSRGDFPIAEGACAEVLSLPCHPELSVDDAHLVTATIREFFMRAGDTT